MFTSTVDSTWFPTCAVFDCDGVLLDSESVWESVQNEFFDRYNLTPSDDVRARLVGSAADDLAQVITDLTNNNRTPAQNAEFKATVLAEVKKGEMNIIDRGVEPIPGALETITKLASAMPVAVASNSSSDLLTKKMELFGYSTVLTTWVGADHVPSPKPAPDMYLEAIRRLGGTPERTFTVEDSNAGATAAQTAGAITFIFTSTPNTAPKGQGYFSSFTDPHFTETIDCWVAAAQQRER